MKDIDTPPTPTDSEPAPSQPSGNRNADQPLRDWISAHKIKLIASLSVLLVVTAALLAYPNLLNWRIHSLATKALRLADEKNWEEASSTALAAYRLCPKDRPKDTEVLRCVATILTHRRDREAIKYWLLLIDSPAATLDDRRSFIESTFGDQSSISKADEQLRILLEKEPNYSRNWLLNAKVNEMHSDSAKMLSCARHAHELDPSDEEATLYLATQLMHFPDTQKEGFTLLWTLVEGNGKKNLDACVLAAQQKNLTDEQMDRLILCLKNAQSATTIQKLAALELEVRKHPDQLQTLLDNAVKENRETGGEALQELGMWLNLHGAFSWTLTAIPPDVAKGNRHLFQVYLEALFAMKKWQQIDTIMAEPGIPLEAYKIEYFKARCADELGDRDQAIIHWRSAQSAAVGNAEQAFDVARYARQSGRSAQAESIYRSLTVNPSAARNAYIELLGMANSTSAIRSLLADMLKHWPKDPAIQNDYAYYCILLGEDVEQHQQTAIQLVNQSPSFLSHRSTLALALLRLSQPKEALELYKGLETKWELAPIRFRAIYAAVLNANGQKDEARKMLESFKTDALRPEEQELIKF